MAKKKSRKQSKSKRRRKTGGARSAARSPQSLPSRDAPAAAHPAPEAPKATTPDLQAEYRYVIADLKRIAVVATSMFALLTVLALFLT